MICNENENAAECIKVEDREDRINGILRPAKVNRRKDEIWRAKDFGRKRED